LYEPAGDRFSGEKYYQDYRGVIAGYKPEYLGRHMARIEVYDAAGNMAQLEFSYILAPGATLFDSEILEDSLLFIKPGINAAGMDIKELNIWSYTPRTNWRLLQKKELGSVPDFELRIPLGSGKDRPAALKIETIGVSGWKNTEKYIFPDRLENSRYSFDYSMQDGGIKLDINSPNAYSPPPKIRAVCEDSSVIEIGTTPIALNKYVAYYRTGDLNSRIIRFDLIDSFDQTKAGRVCDISLGGNQSQGLSPMGNRDFQVVLDSNSFYSPALVDLEVRNVTHSLSNAAISSEIEISPEIFPLANDVMIRFRANQGEDSRKLGIGRASGSGAWQWLGPISRDSWVSSKSGRLGRFALVRDLEPPRISNLNPHEGSTITSSHPRISCNITDNLSGIESDKDVTILLDGKWLIPEYDPETTQLKTYPRDKLTKGKHRLEISVSDGAGNSRKIESIFYVKGK